MFRIRLKKLLDAFNILGLKDWLRSFIFKAKGFANKLVEIFRIFLVVVISDLYLRKYFSSLKFIYFMGKIVSCCICLDGKLQLSDYFVVNYNL